MLADSSAYGGFSVDDLDAARRFYGGTLGLRTSAGPEIVGGLLRLHLGSGAEVLVYATSDHVPATFTVLGLRTVACGTAASAERPWAAERA